MTELQNDRQTTALAAHARRGLMKEHMLLLYYHSLRAFFWRVEKDSDCNYLNLSNYSNNLELQISKSCGWMDG